MHTKNSSSSRRSFVRLLGGRLSLFAAAVLPAVGLSSVAGAVEASHSERSSLRGSIQVEQMLLRAVYAGNFDQAWDMTGPFAAPEVVAVVNRLMDQVEFRPGFMYDPPMMCFSETDPPKPEVMAAVNRAMLQFLDPGYNLGARWSGTAGTPRALTWSFIPDGTSIPAEPGLTSSAAPSNLFAQMDSKFASAGGRATWIAQFQACFDRWAALTGTSYTRITVGGNDWDDGATFLTSAGAAGARGDCRIGGRTLDGANGVLAYNYFPSTGDMVIDTSENWQSSTNSYRFLRNTVMHEHGHGLGFQHVCSNNSGQLMEPFLSTSFDGPQHDDLRAANQHYGDAYESNNTSATATILGTLNAGGSFNPSTVPAPAVSNGSLTSISNDGDVDFYRITTTGSINLSVTVTPVGFSYDDNPQNGDGTCASGSTTNSLTIADLVITLYASNGTTVLTTANATGVGGTETITNFPLTTIGNYFIRVSENNTPTESQLYTISISATAGGCTSPGIVTQPSSTSACEGGNASFTVVASGTTPSYQWRRGTTNLVNGGSISGATSSTLTITGVVAGDAASDYNCVITNACGSVTSSNASLSVSTALGFTQNPSSTSACVGGNASFSVVATGSPTYQWRRGFTNLVDGGSISGATTPNLTITGVVTGDAGNYTCVISNACGNLTSNFATLGVSTGPAVTTQPSSLTRCTGASASFTIAFSGSPTPTLQWRKNGIDISGATNATYSIASVSSGDQGNYDCVVTNSCGSVTSNIASLTVNTAPSITSNPASIARCEGASASFSVAASGTPAPTFQWRKNSVNIGGATSATYTIPSVGAGDLGTYDCVVTNACGSSTSTGATLTINTAPGITTQPVGSARCVGDEYTLFVVASGSPAPTYQWRLNGSNIPGATGASLGLNNITLADDGNYDCVVTNTCGSVTSNQVALVVNSGPSITTQPTAQSVSAGASAVFSVAVSGSPSISYVWRKDTVNLTNGGSISGADSDTLTISPAGAGDAGSYDVVVTNDCGSVTSDAAGLTVNTGCITDVDDGSGTGTPDGGTTIDDLLYYLAIFENGDPSADVDDGSGTGTLDGGVTIDDLLYFLVRFELGC
jgi:hypothetical protein